MVDILLGPGFRLITAEITCLKWIIELKPSSWPIETSETTRLVEVLKRPCQTSECHIPLSGSGLRRLQIDLTEA